MLFYYFLFCPYSTTHSPPSSCFLFPRQVPTSSSPQPKIIQKGTYKRFFEPWDVIMNGHRVQGRYSSPSTKKLITQSQDEELHVFGLGIQCYASSCLYVFRSEQKRWLTIQDSYETYHILSVSIKSLLQVWFNKLIVKNSAYEYAVAWERANTTGVYICVTYWGGNIKLSLDVNETSLKSAFFHSWSYSE